MQKKGSISAPGRICLFGEHQDYLGLPVIPMAINKRLTVHYELQENPIQVELNSNEFDFTEEIPLSSIPQLTGSLYDYLKAVFIYFWQEKPFPQPSRILIDSNIPIRAGLSSSAALLTSMVYLLSNIILNRNSNANTVAEIAYLCEHDILGISCGRMDQYASSLGGIFHMTPHENPHITTLHPMKDAFFIIGNSGVERKADTPLKKIQQDITDALKAFKNPDLKELNEMEIKSAGISKLHKKRLLGVIGVRNNAQNAYEELSKTKADLSLIGQLLTEQQTFLRENYQVSHPKLDTMCEVALKEGALGTKLTGAGFGGAMFALAAEKKGAIRIRNALQQYGDSHITQIDSGVQKD